MTTRRRLTSYGGLDASTPEFHEPSTLEELRRLLARAHAEGRTLAIRGGGCSMDAQSLHDDLVVSLARFNRIVHIDLDRARVTVESGARWGDILRCTHAVGLAPYSVVTTEMATAGGTLAADCISRNTPVHGREGRHVASFRLLTVAGDELECSRRDNPEIFHAVVGGFGYLGVVVEITYDLLRIGDKTQIETITGKCTSLESLVARLDEETADPAGWDAVYAMLVFSGVGYKGFVMRSRYTASRRYKRMLLHQPKHWLRVPVEWLLRSPVVNNLAMNFIHRTMEEGEAYVDDLDGYTFFMDGHRRAKEIARSFGVELTTVQQTFVIPERRLLEFLRSATSSLRERRRVPNLFDILHVPADDFLLSSTRSRSGYAVSLAFDDRPTGLAEVRELLQQLSGVCLALGGRVHLIKNVYATPAQLQAMYGDALERFLDLKVRLDPRGVLHNPFLDRLCGRRASVPLEQGVTAASFAPASVAAVAPSGATHRGPTMAPEGMERGSGRYDLQAPLSIT